jgi:hypothetical protein
MSRKPHRDLSGYVAERRNPLTGDHNIILRLQAGGRREPPLQLGDPPWQEVAASPAIEYHLITTAAPFDMFVEFGFDDEGNLDDGDLDEDVVSDELGDDCDEVSDPLRYGRR